MKPLAHFVSEETIEYLGLAGLLEAITPMSEAARFAWMRPVVFESGDEAALAEHHERLVAAIELLENEPTLADRILHELRGVPRLDEVWGMPFGASELAVLQIFRFHHAKLKAAIQEAKALSDWLGLTDTETLDEKVLPNVERKSFYLDDNSDARLAKVRARILAIRARLDEADNSQREALAKRYGFSKSAEQWVVDRKETKKLDALFQDDDVMLIAETIASYRFGPRPKESFIEDRQKLNQALAKERSIEAEIHRAMEKALRPKRTLWFAEQEKIVKLDLLLQFAKAAIMWEGVKPRCRSEANHWEIVEGAHVGIRAFILQQGRSYEPITIKLDERSAVITGANMGGKTVALQSIGYLQTAFQLGFFLPAKHYDAPLFRYLFAIAGQGGSLGGLSGFGREMASFSKALPLRDERAFYLIDEPGRSTHVKEGRALVQAILDVLASADCMAIVATHLDGLHGKRLAHWKMAGLNRERLEQSRAENKAEMSLHDLMDYRLMVDEAGGQVRSDAIDVAELLGLEAKLIEMARTHMARAKD